MESLFIQLDDCQVVVVQCCIFWKYRSKSFQIILPFSFTQKNIVLPPNHSLLSQQSEHCLHSIEPGVFLRALTFEWHTNSPRVIFSWDRTNYFNIEKWHPSALRSSVFGEGWFFTTASVWSEGGSDEDSSSHLCRATTEPQRAHVPEPACSALSLPPPHKWALWISGGEATVNPHCCADLDLNAGQIHCHLSIVAGAPGQWIRTCANSRWEDGFRCTCAESRDPKARVYAN